MVGEFSLRFLVHVKCYAVTAGPGDTTAEFLIVETIPSVGS